MKSMTSSKRHIINMLVLSKKQRFGINKECFFEMLGITYQKVH